MSKQIALVLSGGGARGLAHIGVIEELEKRGYTITAIAGTSMGALVGGVYAAGKLEELKEWVLQLNQLKLIRLMDLSFQNKGLIKGAKIINQLAKMIPDVAIEDLPIPFSAVAADVLGRKEVVFSEGSLHEAVRASTAIPTLFTPVQRDGMILTDGGILNNLPVNHVKKSRRSKIFAVDVNAHKAPFKMPMGKEQIMESATWMQRNPIVKLKQSTKKTKDNDVYNYSWILDRSLSIMIEQIALSSIERNPPDLLMNISRETGGTLDFLKAEQIIETGRYCAIKYLDEYEKKVSEGFFDKIYKKLIPKS